MLLKPESANETYKTDDLLDFSAYVKDLRTIVDSSNHMSLIGIVGAYGSGKSVMLEAFRRKLRRKHKWVHMDAWKYPDRSDLWEGFVLDFARQVKPRQFKKVLGKLDGTSTDGLRTLIKSVGALSNVFLPGSDKAVDKLAYFAQSSPAKRVFQIQDIFKQLLKDIDETIYVVAEDIDRSGEAGIFFIETLNQFLKELDVKNSIKVLIPISDKSFESEKQQAYVKALDYIQFFDIGSRSLERFVDEVFARELTTDAIKKDHILEILQRLVHDNGLTYRQLKLVIRNAELRHKAIEKRGFKSDARVVLAIEASRFVTTTNNGTLTRFVDMKQNEYIEYNTQLGVLLYAIILNRSVSETVTFLNGFDSLQTQYREVIRIGDHTRAAQEGIDVAVPFMSGDKYRIPLYYID